MNNSKIEFPNVIEIQNDNRVYPENYIFPEEWFSYQYRFLKEYFLKILQGWSVTQFFGDDFRGNIAIYSLIEFAELLLGDVCRFCKKVYLADKNVQKYEKGFLGHQVLNPNHNK